MTTQEVLIEMDHRYAFWSVKCVNEGAGRHARGKFRRYECCITSNGRRVRTTAATLLGAITQAMTKMESVEQKFRLKLVGGA